jgi:hypothetical protein
MKIKAYQVKESKKHIRRLTDLLSTSGITPDEQEELYGHRKLVNDWEEYQELRAERRQREKEDS